LNAIHVPKPVECQLKTTNVQGNQAPAKRQKMLKKIRELIHEDRHRKILELADAIGISYGVCQEILTEILYMCHIVAKFVLRLLTNDQKQWHMNMCLELREKANKDSAFISRIITDKVGFTVMIQKQSDNHRNGRAHNHKEQKRRGRSGVQQRACSLFFST
jgi:hypothetical protein